MIENVLPCTKISLVWSRKNKFVMRRSFWSNYIFMKVISNERFLKSSFDILTKRKSFFSFILYIRSMIYLTFHCNNKKKWYPRFIFFFFSYQQFNYLQESKKKKLWGIHLFTIVFILYLINIERIHTSSTYWCNLFFVKSIVSFFFNNKRKKWTFLNRKKIRNCPKKLFPV